MSIIRTSSENRNRPARPRAGPLRLGAIAAAILVVSSGLFASAALGAAPSDARIDHLATLATQHREIVCGGLPTEDLLTVKVGETDLSVNVTEDAFLHSIVLDSGSSATQQVLPYAYYSLKFVPIPGDVAEIDALSTLMPTQVWTERSYGSLPEDGARGSVLFKHIPLQPGVWWITTGDDLIGGKILAKFKAATVTSARSLNAQAPRESESCASVEQRVGEVDILVPSLPPIVLAQGSSTRPPDATQHYCTPGRSPGSSESRITGGRMIDGHSERKPGATHLRYIFGLHLDVTVYKYDGRCFASVHEQHADVAKIYFSVYGPSEAPAQAGVTQWTGFGLGIEPWQDEGNSPRGWYKGTALKGPFIHVQDGGNFRAGEVRHIAYTGQKGTSKAHEMDLVMLALRALRMPKVALVTSFVKYLDDTPSGPTQHTSTPGCVHACLNWETSSALAGGSHFGFEASIERRAPGYSAYPVEFGVEDFEFHRTYERKDRGSVRAALPPFGTFIPMWST